MFVSYAQNHEDVLLWRALGEVENGFYIDVGASDPNVHSVTRAFYERGWSGVNIEPLRHHADRLKSQRERDITLQAIVGTKTGSTSFFEVLSGDGLSTTSERLAKLYGESGSDIASSEVACISLAEIFERYAKRDVHFLKIDVEGAERDVLMSGDFSKFRPWVVIIEAIRPFNSLSQPTSDSTYFDLAERCDHEWAGLLSEARYQQCFFDGVNAYFVAEERETALSAKLSIPTNVLDRFVPVEVSQRLELAAQMAELGKYAELVDQALKDIASGLYSATEFFGRAEAARAALVAIERSAKAKFAVEGRENDR